MFIVVACISVDFLVYMDTLTKNNWRDVLKAAKEEMKNVSVSGSKAAAVLDEDDFDVLHLLSTVKQNCPLHLSDRDSIAVLFHLVSDLGKFKRFNVYNCIMKLWILFYQDLVHFAHKL